MDEFDIWNPVPPGSKVCGVVRAQGADYVAEMRVVKQGAPPGTTFGTGALAAGACEQLQAGFGYGIGLEIYVGDEGPAVDAELTLVDSQGQTIRTNRYTPSQPNTNLRVIITAVPA